MLAEPDELVQRVEGEMADAADLHDAVGIDVAAHVPPRSQRPRAFPADHRKACARRHRGKLPSPPKVVTVEGAHRRADVDLRIRHAAESSGTACRRAPRRASSASPCDPDRARCRSSRWTGDDVAMPVDRHGPQVGASAIQNDNDILRHDLTGSDAGGTTAARAVSEPATGPPPWRPSPTLFQLDRQGP